MTNTATHIRDIEGGRGNVALYRLDPPLTYTHYTGEEDTEVKAPYVYVSAVAEIPETYIFHAPPTATEFAPVSWGELSGSMKGTTSHIAALNNAGYEVISDDR